MLRFLLLVCLWGSTSSEVLSRHKREWIIASFDVEEEEQGPFPHQLGTIEIQRNDAFSYFIVGQGVDEEPQGLLSFDPATFTLNINRAVDFEQHTKFKLWLQALGADGSLELKVRVNVIVKDINDNRPTFEKDVYTVTVMEERTQGLSLLTVLATDADEAGTSNSNFEYKIKSVSPKAPDIEFFIEKTGIISFKGCLDYEATDKFTVVVEAKDSGNGVKLSSSTTVIINVQDGNNNLPVFSRQLSSVEVKEHEVGASILRLQVTDKDVAHTPAWRANYTVHGAAASHFTVETDGETNDGILTVVKPLKFKDTPQLSLSISVENEVPYFSCKVLEKTSVGLWKVSSGRSQAMGSLQSSVKVVVVDVNDPPEFIPIETISLEENSPIGAWVETVKAVDSDSNQATQFVYKVGRDPAGWLRVDPKTGDITTVRSPDRESPHVVDGVYTVTLLAVESGSQPMTGSTTLKIHIRDVNDNLPQPVVDTVTMCLSEVPTTANISTSDLDGEPFGGPFSYELLGDVAGMWRLDPAKGFSAGLVKEPDVYAGRHEVRLKISALQGESAIYTISVIVCDCSLSRDCQSRRASGTRVSFSAVGIVLAALLLPPVLLLLVVSISCKEEFTPLQLGIAKEDVLLQFNTEERGTDCMIPDSLRRLSAEGKRRNSSVWHSQCDGMQRERLATKGLVSTQRDVKKSLTQTEREDVSFLFSSGQTNWTTQEKTCMGRHQVTAEDLKDSMTSGYSWNGAVQFLLQQKLLSLHAAEEALQEDWLFLYTDEGELDKQAELDRITIPDDGNSLQQALSDLGPAFIPLASIAKLHNNMEFVS